MFIVIQVAKNANFRFFGNTTVQCDEGLASDSSVTVSGLLQAGYSAVVLAYGSESNRQLGIPGEQLKGVLSAREFVNWYNGHPDFSSIGDEFDLSKTKNVVVIGQGNVGLDCARILAKPLASLESTDLTSASLSQLASSKVSSILIAGRRGHVQAAFTIKEFRELTKIPKVKVRISRNELRLGSTDSSNEEIKMRRPLQRITKLIDSIAEEDSKCLEEDDFEKIIDIRFLLSPSEIKEGIDENSQRTGRVGSVVFKKCHLEGPPNGQRAVPTGEVEEVPCDLLLTAVGYKALPMAGVPFDSIKNTIPHRKGRVLKTLPHENSEDNGGYDDSTVFPGVYVTGWCKRGPVGIVGSNIVDAKETVASLLDDIRDNKTSVSPKDPADWLKSKCEANEIVSWDDHLILDTEERRRGESSTPVKKPREKVTDVKEMLDIITNGRS